MDLQNTTHKIVIIGSGPAGHTAAIYTSRGFLQPIMFEGWLAGGITAGGQLTTTSEVENFPGFPDGISGPALMENMRKQSIHFGTTILTETVESIDLQQRPFIVSSNSTTLSTHAIIFATGAIAKRLGIKGEQLYWDKGISACAVCDGALPIFRDKPLIVIGGGDSACEEATFLTKFGSKVYLAVRRNKLRASKTMQERVINNPKIEILWETEIVEAMGGEGLQGTLHSVNITQKGTISTLAVNGLFYAIGHIPNTKLLEKQISLDDAGYIITQPGSTKCSVEGIFACGDVQDPHYRQAITSAGSGCMAALDAENWLLSNNKLAL